MQASRWFRFEITPGSHGEGTLLVELVNARAGVRGEISVKEIDDLIAYLLASRNKIAANLKGDDHGSKI